MPVNYSLPKPTQGQSRDGAVDEIDLLTDLSDTVADAGTRLDTIEAVDYATQAELDAVAAAKANVLVTVDNVAATSYTVVAADAGKVKRFTAAGAVTVSLPDGVAVGTLVNLLFVGAAGGSVAASGTATVNGAGSVVQHGEASCLVSSADTWHVQGAS